MRWRLPPRVVNPGNPTMSSNVEGWGEGTGDTCHTQKISGNGEVRVPEEANEPNPKLTPEQTAQHAMNNAATKSNTPCTLVLRAHFVAQMPHWLIKF